MIIELLCRLFPTLTPEKARDFLNMQFAAAIGLFQMTDLSDLQKEVLGYPEFEHLKVNFAPAYTQAVEYILAGILR